MPTTRRKRIAIVGGGCAAMAAAWDLTADEPSAAGASCDVTIFQIGGRLGGKGASSRNDAYGDRIEEHGLHLWLGYYENAFRMIRTCFEELKDSRSNDPELSPHLENQPFNNWNWLSAFERAGLVSLADYSSGDWVPWVARFPEYVPRSEDGVTGVYTAPDGSTIPGVHIVNDPRRAYPGEAPVVLRGEHCEDGEDVCLEKPTVAFFLTHALRELLAFVESLELRIEQLSIRGGAVPPEDPDALLSQFMNMNPVTHAADLNVLSGDVPRALRIVRLTYLVPAIQALTTLARFVQGPLPHVRERIVAMLDRFIDEMREKIEDFVARDIPARRIWELIDLIAANIRGLVASGLEGTDDFSSLDEYNYEDWLRMNGVSERTLRNPIVRGAHDLGFAYYQGNPRDPQIAAGQAINAGCRFFFMYKGALFWRMKAGMGDVVFAPMYLALRKRGVKFRFFHRLEDIELAADGKTVNRLKFWRQVKLRIADPAAPTNYHPLVVVEGAKMSGWLPQPDLDQFDYDDETRKRYRRAISGEDEQTNADFESIWCNWKYGAEVFATVGEGNATDFNDVIVTVPVAALGRVSQQLANATDKAGHRSEAARRWKAMLNGIGTVATQSVQLWVNKKTTDLGWTRGQVSLSAFVHPFDTWADLSQLIAVENQPEAKGVHYFCSVLPQQYVPAIDTDPTQIVPILKRVREVVKENTKGFLSAWIFHLWPKAVHRYPNTFKWEFLVAPGLTGADRLNAQHIVANVDPSEQYTQTLPGTTKYRIRPDGTGFRHLFIAGDWTDCGLNFGCVEAAVISGRLASSGIRGYPDVRLIPGYIHSRGHVAVMKGDR